MMKQALLASQIILVLLTTFAQAAEEPVRKSKYLFDFIRQSPGMTERIKNDAAGIASETKNINSPIYYIKMPPNPYTFVPGVGYISKPQGVSNRVQDFVNLPLPFIGNGRPVSIYQWSQIPLTPVPNNPSKDSTINRLPGTFLFNGKPSKEIFVLKHNFNTLFNDHFNQLYP